ncbi:6-O-methylguanine DNA methyltransferase, DNA binding domain containing protein [Novymonas esmeraldas]|uniref:Methylated-DNA--protein-cysteine methyltransferase n=1 Tax=Novymonas esmeraldas TaxID=1808958 RepID=A0AAW0EJR8_9TRYP
MAAVAGIPKAAVKAAVPTAKCTRTPTAATLARRVVAAAVTLAALPLHLRTVATPLGPFSVYVDGDGAVRCCHWQRCPRGDAAALEAEAREVCAEMQTRWYRSTAVTLARVWPEEPATTAAAEARPGDVAVALLSNYFQCPSPSAGRPAALEKLLLQVPVVYPTATTAFTSQTWTTLRQTVPSGDVISYKGLGVRVNNALLRSASAAAAPRAVGAAMAANPIPVIVPCHRVVASSGSLRGYGLGLRYKVWLLRHEQATVAAEVLRACEDEAAVSTAASRR